MSPHQHVVSCHWLDAHLAENRRVAALKLADEARFIADALNTVEARETADQAWLHYGHVKAEAEIAATEFEQVKRGER